MAKHYIHREPASVVGEPSDEELTQFFLESFRGPVEFLCLAEEEAHLMIRSHVKFARATLLRYGHHPAPPAEGEREELAQWLEGQSADLRNFYKIPAGRFSWGVPASPETRFAALLISQRAALLERAATLLRQPTLLCQPTLLRQPIPPAEPVSERPPLLPATTLPLPSGEVQP